MSVIAANLQAVRNRIHLACQHVDKTDKDVTLLAVSKHFPAEAVSDAFNAGQHHFGENYVQEGVSKITRLSNLRQALTWHFIGPLQSNKTRDVAKYFDWVHSVERLKIAERLDAQRPAELPPLQICLQINISGESTKSGITPQEAPALAIAIAALPRIQLRGLMVIPEPSEFPSDSSEARAPFAATHALFSQCRDALASEGLSSVVQYFDTLSMGMSADLEAAIFEGANIVRVGTAIFGARNTST